MGSEAPPVQSLSEFIGELESLPESSTVLKRKLRHKYSKRLALENASYVFDVAHSIFNSGRHRWIAYELIHDHPGAFHSLDRKSLEALGRGMNNWSSVDCFSRTLAGPAWLEGLIAEDTIRDWTLRALVFHNPGEVKEFINAHEGVLAARIKREVRNKLRTGLKNP